MQKALPIVFIPGASSDEATWEAQRAYFSKKADVTVVNLTQYDDIEEMADYVLERAPSEFAVCGTSMGGYVALAVLKKAKGRVKKAALCNTSARADTPERRKERAAEIALGEEAYIKSRHEEGHYDALISKKSAKNAALIAALRETSLRVGYGCFSRHQTACAGRDESLSFLSQIDMPVLVIGGAEDALIPPALQQEIHENIKGSKLAILQDAGHIAQMETAEAMTEELDRFFFAA